ncbi:DUF6011 domain-containing protein [Streptomyces sp. NPDC016845]|uniref:DUF6011 domain-containing protein n=1 Tax=Streptomyces sp. NPDC016845 TaxID=3364972 RepID=UPI0037A646BE
MQNTTTTEQARCLHCHRILTSAKSIALGYGPRCARKIRNAAVDTSDYKAHQIASARELIADAAIIPLRSVVFLAVSTDGTETYRSTPTACTCPAGLKGARCYHQLAARLLLAA